MLIINNIIRGVSIHVMQCLHAVGQGEHEHQASAYTKALPFTQQNGQNLTTAMLLTNVTGPRT